MRGTRTLNPKNMLLRHARIPIPPSSHLCPKEDSNLYTCFQVHSQGVCVCRCFPPFGLFYSNSKQTNCKSLVPKGGLEPPLLCRNHHLKVTCLPFHHLGIFVTYLHISVLLYSISTCLQWCLRRDLNPHDLSITRFLVWAVYQFQHIGTFKLYSIILVR